MQYSTEFCYTRHCDRHRKELAKITNQPNKIHNAERYTPKELKELILAAQAADEKAIESLCETFKPLILKESHYPSIFDILGEDAVNTAWVIFLQFIKNITVMILYICRDLFNVICAMSLCIQPAGRTIAVKKHPWKKPWNIWAILP